jgi:hypothetical protein
VTEARNVNDASRQPDAGEMLERALRRARWTTLWERLWPPLVTIATAVGIFLAVSWLGVWLWLPPIGRAIVLSGFLVLTVAAIVPLAWVRFPSRHDGLRRLDRNAGLPHRPATAIGDQLATPKSDPWSAALWRAHVERALLAARTLKAGRPAPRLTRRAIRSLCALVLMLVVATFIATYQPAVGKLFFWLHRPLSGEGPPMYWYGWIVLAAASALEVAWIATILVSGQWLRRATVFCCVLATL